MTLVGVSIFVFRIREPDRVLSYRVPLYPITPTIFVATCLWMLYSSLVYTGAGALFGVAVLAVGAPLMLLARKTRPGTDTV